MSNPQQNYIDAAGNVTGDLTSSANLAALQLQFKDLAEITGGPSEYTAILGLLTSKGIQFYVDGLVNGTTQYHTFIPGTVTVTGNAYNFLWDTTALNPFHDPAKDNYKIHFSLTL